MRDGRQEEVLSDRIRIHIPIGIVMASPITVIDMERVAEQSCLERRYYYVY